MDNQQGMDARRQSLPNGVLNLLSRRRFSEPSAQPMVQVPNSPEVSQNPENVVLDGSANSQCYPEWLRQCGLLKWLWDSGPVRTLRGSSLGRRLGGSNLGLWLDSRCPTLTNLLLLKVALWLLLVWILSDLHMGLPCFLLTVTYWLYEGPLSRAVDWVRGRNRARPTPAVSTPNTRRAARPSVWSRSPVPCAQ